MRPLIQSGAILEVTPEGRSPRRWEVWAFCDDEGRVIAHRFVRTLEDGRALFRSDTYGRDDPPVPDDHLVGLVRAIHTPSQTIHLGDLERIRWAIASSRIRRATRRAAARLRGRRQRRSTEVDDAR